MKIVIVDYGMGNIRSLLGALKYIGLKDVVVSDQYVDLCNADKLVLPGVGSFANAMRNIKERNLNCYLKELVIDNKKPILGICLGMQLMGKSSAENGFNEGLGFIAGEVERFKENELKVPHVGFNQVKINNHCKIYTGMSGEMDFYFTHSFKMRSEENINSCFCNYGGEFVASYEVGHIAGVQFHPELSQHNGLNVLKNFVEQF